MSDITADPQTIHQAVRYLKAGDILTLRPGIYSRPVVVVGRQGTQTDPIVIRGTPGVVFDGGRSADDFREEGNRRSIEGDELGYPGLWPFLHEAMITLRRCDHVILEEFDIRRCWPTAIFIQDGQAITIRKLKIEDGTFAIGALGSKTYGITIESVHWCQDVTRDRLWRQIPWAAVHEDNGVDIKNDWRLFDGDFFRSSGIAGGVRISRCIVEHAFNAVHGFNPEKNPRLSRDFAVHDCQFSYIRDNVFEPEDFAQNWWFYRNRICNCHKWFSLEASSSKFIYIFANLGWFDEIPGQPSQDNRAGGVFKLAKTQTSVSGHQYVFNNSFAVRSDYIRKGTLRGLRHWANAVRYCSAGEGACDSRARFFGDLSQPQGSTDERFTTGWAQWDIAFGDDVILHPEYTIKLQEAGYGPFSAALPADPGFRDAVMPGANGDGLRLASGSTCRGRALAQTIELPDGRLTYLPAGRDVGAFQGTDLLSWQEFVPLLQSLT